MNDVGAGLAADDESGPLQRARTSRAWQGIFGQLQSGIKKLPGRGNGFVVGSLFGNPLLSQIAGPLHTQPVSGQPSVGMCA